jgi:hypothetical protein
MTADNVRSEAAVRRPSGKNRGRFDPSLNVAILEAALAGLGELGYDRMSMDDIASRARVGKAAIYRRWPSKAAVVAEAIAHWRRGLGPVDSPNTGSLRGDIDGTGLRRSRSDHGQSGRRRGDGGDERSRPGSGAGRPCAVRAASDRQGGSRPSRGPGRDSVGSRFDAHTRRAPGPQRPADVGGTTDRPCLRPTRSRAGGATARDRRQGQLAIPRSEPFALRSACARGRSVSILMQNGTVTFRLYCWGTDWEAS